LKLYLIRHTKPHFEPGTCYGQSDIDVADTFIQESLALRAKIENIQIDAVYSSPLQRCSKLASDMQLGVIQHDERIKELNFGDWEMQKWDALPRETFDYWSHNYANIAPPNGETFAELHQRCLSFIEDLKSQHHNQHVAVFTHGGVIRAMLAEVLNMPLKGLFRFNIDYASVTELDFNHPIPKIGFVNR